MLCLNIANTHMYTYDVYSLCQRPQQNQSVNELLRWRFCTSQGMLHKQQPQIHRWQRLSPFVQYIWQYVCWCSGHFMTSIVVFSHVFSIFCPSHGPGWQRWHRGCGTCMARSGATGATGAVGHIRAMWRSWQWQAVHIEIPILIIVQCLPPVFRKFVFWAARKG